jgi:hypothetical protein
LQSFKLHVSPVQGPIVGLLEHHGADLHCCRWPEILGTQPGRASRRATSQFEAIESARTRLLSPTGLRRLADVHGVGHRRFGLRGVERLLLASANSRSRPGWLAGWLEMEHGQERNPSSDRQHRARIGYDRCGAGTGHRGAEHLRMMIPGTECLC